MVDLLLSQKDCYRRSLETVATRCEPEPGGGTRHQVVLECTPFYPEGGGQPSDIGTLQISGSSELVQVLYVQRQEDGSVVHFTSAPVPGGAGVTASVDWARRYDLMQQHTGQHLLSAVCDEVAGADTVSWELHAVEVDPSSGDQEASQDVTVDLATPSLTPEQIQAIEARCNDVVREAREISQIRLDEGNRDALANSPLLRGALPAPGHKLKGPVRLIQIEGVDINACGGTHLRSTAELQIIKVIGLEKTKGMARLRFRAGSRVLSTLSRQLVVEAALNEALGAGQQGWAQAVARLQLERRSLAKRCKALLEETAATAGLALAASSHTLSRVPHYHRDDGDAAYLGMVATAALKAKPASLLLLTGGMRLIPKPSRSSCGDKPRVREGCFVLAGAPEDVARMGPLVAEALGAGKGGGRPGLFQGKCPSWDGLDAAKALLAADRAQSALLVPMTYAPHAPAPCACMPALDAAGVPAAAAAPNGRPLLVGSDAPSLFDAQQALLENVREAERRLKSFNLKSEREKAAYLMYSEHAQQAQGFSIVGSMPMGSI